MRQTKPNQTKKMTHTPAPWKVHTEKGKIGILTENNVEHLATCYGFRKEQNARLIATAPELLAALIAIEKQADFSAATSPLRSVRGDLLTIVENARAAISKATA